MNNPTELTTLLADLVRIDSINPDLIAGAKSEADVAAFIADWATRTGLEVIMEDAAPGRPNVIVIARGSGGGKNLMLNGHTDTVGLTGMEEPFSARIEGNRMYGRGTYELSLAAHFMQQGSTVIICGRNKNKLDEAKAKYPQITPYVCDVAKAEEREAMFQWVSHEFPKLNILINNAGIQRIAPIYSATKAGLHSFTLSLRQQLLDTPIAVLEIIPPAVNTDLGGKGLHTFGVDVNEFTTAIVKQLEAGQLDLTRSSSTPTKDKSG